MHPGAIYARKTVGLVLEDRDVCPVIRRPYKALQGVSALQTSLVLPLTLSLGTELFKHGDGAPQDFSLHSHWGPADKSSI